MTSDAPILSREGKPVPAVLASLSSSPTEMFCFVLSVRAPPCPPPCPRRENKHIEPTDKQSTSAGSASSRQQGTAPAVSPTRLCSGEKTACPVAAWALAQPGARAAPSAAPASRAGNRWAGLENPDAPGSWQNPRGASGRPRAPGEGRRNTGLSVQAHTFVAFGTANKSKVGSTFYRMFCQPCCLSEGAEGRFQNVLPPPAGSPEAEK